MNFTGYKNDSPIRIQRIVLSIGRNVGNFGERLDVSLSNLAILGRSKIIKESEMWGIFFNF